MQVVPAMSSQGIIHTNGAFTVAVPSKQLADYSVQVGPTQKKFVDWTDEDIHSSFNVLDPIVSVWKTKNVAEQYLVYGKQEGSKPFVFEAVPYQTKTSAISRLWQQFLVLWRVTFGGKTAEQRDAQVQLYKTTPASRVAPSTSLPSDAFCNRETINKQWVITGTKVNVLFNYAPIGELHFLIVPKAHREKFTDLEREEYVEAQQLTQRIVKHYSANDAYIFHRTGKDAGQSVPHWHQHVILTANKTQSFFGKLMVLKNTLFGASPMNETALKTRVTALRSELNPPSK